jgi:hypothetical protein
MFKRLFLPAAVAVATLCAPAVATPATVQLRIEGATSTIFEGPVTTQGKAIDKGGGPHPCDGTTRTTPPNPGPGPTMTSALDDASLAAGFQWTATWFDFGDFLVTSVGPPAENAGSGFWGTVLNFQPTPVGGCQQQVRAGDEALFAFGDVFAQPLLKLSGPTIAPLGQQATVTVVSGKDGSAVPGATITGAPGSPSTGADGTAQVAFDSPGVKRLKSEAPGAIRSSALLVCVPQRGAADCGPATPRSTAGFGALARDTRAPRARISSPSNGRRYRRGPRLLRGSATDDATGVGAVRLALRQYVPGKRCRWWNGNRERFVKRGCRSPLFFAAGTGERWSYLLPRALPRGRYLLQVQASDRAGNREQRFERSRTRIGFSVTSPRLRRAALRRAALHSRRAPRAPVVRVLVFGGNGVLAGAS